MNNYSSLFYIILFIGLLACNQQTKSLVNTPSTTKQTTIVAHRGFSSIAPENTLSAFSEAIQSGAEYFELDVHKTADDAIVVIHDKTVDRTSSNMMTGRIDKMTFDQIQKVKVGFVEKFGNQYMDEKIPTLEEALLLAKSKIKVCIEIKVHGAEEKILHIINKTQMHDDVIIFSFYYDVLLKIRQLDPNIKLLYLKDHVTTEDFSYAKLIKASAIGVGYATNPTKEFIHEAHRQGIEIWKWTVNSEDQMHDLISIGLDGLITNFPNKALSIRKSLSASEGKFLKEISPSQRLNQRVEKLMANMSLEDKIGEMTQLSIDMLLVGKPYQVKEPLEFDQEKLQKALVDFKVGSILNNGGHARPLHEWHKIIRTIQQYAVQKKSTHIPVLYGIDAIHGANYVSNATLYPQQLNLATTWNPDLVRQLTSITAYETRASGVPWAFAPVLDLGRDPRWSRFWETFGEDVFLAKQMTKASIMGLQGNDISAPTKLAACMKHFLGYSIPRTGKDRSPVFLAERQLREYFLPSFQTAIQAGAKTIMINSGELNGIPVHADERILTGLLRRELGFTGLAVTDWEDIKYLYTRHHVAKDYKDAIRIAINAGIDMSMVPLDLDFPVLLKELVLEGKVPLRRIDQSVRRILTVKTELGLFEDPLMGLDDDNYELFGSDQYQKLALQGALESIVLLKNNNNLLPLNGNKNILVCGPTAHSLAALNGAWTGTWQGNDPQYDTPGKQTIFEAITAKFGQRVQYVPGTQIDKEVDIQLAVRQAKKADVAILCLGEMPYVEIPGNIHDLSLPKAQIDLVKAISNTGVPIVLILVQGRPRIIQEIEPLADAILFAGLPGNEGAPALTQILSGDYNPNGRLCFSYPRYVHDLKLYDHKGTDQIDKHFGTNVFNPQWSFAHGLSYTSFEYKDLEIDNSAEQLKISLRVKNTGNRDGLHVIPLFITDKVATITPSVKRLRGFKKIHLNAGESKKIEFNITKNDLKFVGKNNQWIFEHGDFLIQIGDLKKECTL